jgi:hypothetical protein
LAACPAGTQRHNKYEEREIVVRKVGRVAAAASAGLIAPAAVLAVAIASLVAYGRIWNASTGGQADAGIAWFTVFALFGLAAPVSLVALIAGIFAAWGSYRNPISSIPWLSFGFGIVVWFVATAQYELKGCQFPLGYPAVPDISRTFWCERFRSVLVAAPQLGAAMSVVSVCCICCVRVRRWVIGRSKPRSQYQ